MKRWKKRLLYFLAFLLVCAFIVTWWILPPYITKVNAMAELRGGRRPQKAGLAQMGDLMTISGQGEARLSCLWMEAPEDKGTVLLFHGIRANKAQMLDEAQMVKQAGYNALLIDGRAHGASNLEYCSFGVHEAEDTKAILDHLESEGLGNGKYAVWGYSLGGSVALQSMALDKRIDVGIVECTFGDYREIVHQYMQRFAQDLGWYGDLLIDRAASLADFEPEEACTAASCKRIEQPVFIGHGTHDRSVPIHMGRKNFEALSSKVKVFREVEGAGHWSLHRRGGEAYLQEVMRFLDQHIR